MRRRKNKTSRTSRCKRLRHDKPRLCPQCGYRVPMPCERCGAERLIDRKGVLYG